MPKPFDAVTAKNAAQIAAIVHEMPPEVVGLRFVGGWRRRRFVIADAEPVWDEVASVTKDFENATITLPRSILLSSSDCIRELRSFGAAITRRSQTGSFDVAEGNDHETHVVAQAHHVALCGHRGPWPDDWHPRTALVSCSKCVELAKSKPAHRARLHPLATGHE